MTNDWMLLRRYVRERSETAFTDLVNRHMRLVYGTCLRETGDVDLARDATQVVFLLLARKAPSLRQDVVITGWLFRTARLTARNLARREAARRRRECRWEEASNVVVRPVESLGAVEIYLNEALAALNGRDLDAITLRYFDGLSLREVGNVLGVSEDAARMRVSRSLDRMRGRLAKLGVGVGAMTIASALTTRPMEAAPMSVSRLVDASCHAYHCGGEIGVHLLSLLKGAQKIVFITKVKIAVAGVLAGLTLIGALGYAGHVAGQNPMLHLSAQRLASAPMPAPPRAAASTSTPLPQIDPELQRQAALEQQCKYHLQLIGLAMMEYASDHHNHLPPANHWMDEILPYVKRDRHNISVFHDPGDQSGREFDYAFNSALSGRTLDDVTEPAVTIMVFECASGKRNASGGVELVRRPGIHAGGGHVYGFVDGHVKHYNGVLGRKIRWKP